MADDTKPQLDKSFSLTRREQAQEFGAAPPPDHEKKSDSNTPRCCGCRGYHGSVNEGRHCLVRALDAKDRQIKELREEIASLQLRLRLGCGGSKETVEPEAQKA